MKLFTIESGFFSTDGGAMFGVMSHKIWSKRYPVDAENRCPLAMRCLFVDFGDRKVLFDTGAGTKPLTGMNYYRFHDLVDIEQALNEKGYRAEDVTDVVLSHLHFDHCGGCTKLAADGKTDMEARTGSHAGSRTGAGCGRTVVTFPNARHWTTRQQWENSLRPSYWETDAYLRENMQAVYEAGLLQLLEEDTEIFPGLTLRIFQGHTCGQLVSFIEAGAESTITAGRIASSLYNTAGHYIFSGDVIPMLLHVMQGCVAAIDNCALISVEEKVRLLNEAYRSDSRLFFYHDCGTQAADLKKQNGHISVSTNIPA